MHRLIALALVLAACSEETFDLDPDTNDVFTGEEQACFACDDRDPCTDDFCQDGACVHVPRNAFNACQNDSHCDDGNACTIDSCLVDECNLKRCASASAGPSCQSCDFMPCNDGNPCTTDTCGEDKICTFGAPAEGCDPNCVVSAAFSPGGAQQFTYGSFIGTAQARLLCEGDACTCNNPIALGDGFVAVDLDSGDPEDPFVCTVDACEGTPAACSPLMRDVGYIVWGDVRYLDARFAASDPPPADASGAPQPADTAVPDESWNADVGPTRPVDALVVEGYCLSPRLDHLVGRYAVRFESDGASSTMAAVATLNPVSQRYEISLTDCLDCAATGIVPPANAPLGDLLDTVSFPVMVGAEQGTAMLYGQPTAFVGSVTTPAGKFLGRMTLERLPPE